MEDVGIIYGNLVDFPAVHFTRFGMLYQEKSGNPGTNDSLLNVFPPTWIACCRFISFVSFDFPTG
jgi:hypothetical protein